MLLLVATPTALAAPANDLRSDATIITGDSTSTGSNVGASMEPGEASPCTSIGATVWFRFTAPSAAYFTVDTFGSNFDTVLAVFSAGSNDAITCNDDTMNLQSEVTFAVVEGETYDIQLAGYGGSTGSFVLTVSGPISNSADLTITALSATPLVTEGHYVNVATSFTNLGPGPGPVRFTIDYRLDGVSFQRQVWPEGMPAGWIQNTGASTVAWGVGVHEIEVVIDVDNNMTEENETNNARMVTFEVLPPAEVSVEITQLRHVPLRTEVTDVRHPLSRHEATIQVCNDGPVASDAVYLYLVITGGANGTTGVGSDPIPGRSVGVVAPATCIPTTVRFNAATVVGDFTLHASILSLNDGSGDDNVDEATSFNIVGDEGGVVVNPPV